MQSGFFIFEPEHRNWLFVTTVAAVVTFGVFFSLGAQQCMKHTYSVEDSFMNLMSRCNQTIIHTNSLVKRIKEFLLDKYDDLVDRGVRLREIEYMKTDLLNTTIELWKDKYNTELAEMERLRGDVEAKAKECGIKVDMKLLKVFK